jgi:hypothetical protein
MMTPTTTETKHRRTERPSPEWVRGVCPYCGSELVSNAYHVGGVGYVIFWECWEALGAAPTCDYRRSL